MDLFESSLDTKHQPFAYRMRPENLDEYIGQDHIVSEGRLLRRMIQADQLSSLIFYGPPGTGKTTLARVIANSTKSVFTTMNAVLSGVKNLREEIDLAKERLSLHGKRTILFIDEIHRWNKAQQDALLPWVENGTVILIGATTQNPYFEVNSALVSRSRIFQLRELTKDNLLGIALQALNNKIKGYGKYKIKFEENALEHIVDIANGDARSLLNALELAVETTGETFPPQNDNEIFITLDTAEESIQQKAVLYDKEGDYHFDIISAFIKSIRGSDPDAALYWLAKMVKAGEDPHYIFRRMLISASEDIGLADPNGLVIVESAAAAFDRVGLPEGRYHLTHAALYLATAPKSNSALGFFDALKAIEKEQNSQVPNHLKDA
ncbi:MAG: AAA family ATPase, partial [Spirochaetales bacterium]|nr:AAA family ATPase [Spirochaetales bacterium]